MSEDQEQQQADIADSKVVHLHQLTAHERRGSIGLIGLPNSGKTAFIFGAHASRKAMQNWVVGMRNHDLVGYTSELSGAQQHLPWKATDPKQPHRFFRLFEARRRRSRKSAFGKGPEYAVVVPDTPGELYRLLAKSADLSQGDQRAKRAEALLEDLKQCSGLVCLIDPSLAEEDVSEQASYIESILNQIVKSGRREPLPVAVVMTKSDLLIERKETRRIRLHAKNSLRYKLLRRRKAPIEAQGEWVSYDLSEAEELRPASAAHDEAVAWDFLNAHLPSVAAIVHRLASDERLNARLFMISNWGGALPLDPETGLEVVPKPGEIHPDRVLDPIAYVLDVLHERRTARRSRRLAWAGLALLALFFLAGPMAPILLTLAARASRNASSANTEASLQMLGQVGEALPAPETLLGLLEQHPLFPLERARNPQRLLGGARIWLELAEDERKRGPEHLPDAVELAKRGVAWVGEKGGLQEGLNDLLLQEDGMDGSSNPCELIERLVDHQDSLRWSEEFLHRSKRISERCMVWVSEAVEPVKNALGRGAWPTEQPRSIESDLERLQSFASVLRRAANAPPGESSLAAPASPREIRALALGIEATCAHVRTLDSLPGLDDQAALARAARKELEALKTAYRSRDSQTIERIRSTRESIQKRRWKHLADRLRGTEGADLSAVVLEVESFVLEDPSFLDRALEGLEAVHTGLGGEWKSAFEQEGYPTSKASYAKRLAMHGALPEVTGSATVEAFSPEQEVRAIEPLWQLKELEQALLACVQKPEALYLLPVHAGLGDRIRNSAGVEALAVAEGAKWDVAREIEAKTEGVRAAGKALLEKALADPDLHASSVADALRPILQTSTNAELAALEALVLCSELQTELMRIREEDKEALPQAVQARWGALNAGEGARHESVREALVAISKEFVQGETTSAPLNWTRMLLTSQAHGTFDPDSIHAGFRDELLKLSWDPASFQEYIDSLAHPENASAHQDLMHCLSSVGNTPESKWKQASLHAKIQEVSTDEQKVSSIESELQELLESMVAGAPVARAGEFNERLSSVQRLAENVDHEPTRKTLGQVETLIAEFEGVPGELVHVAGEGDLSGFYVGKHEFSIEDFERYLKAGHEDLLNASGSDYQRFLDDHYMFEEDGTLSAKWPGDVKKRLPPGCAAYGIERAVAVAIAKEFKARLLSLDEWEYLVDSVTTEATAAPSAKFPTVNDLKAMGDIAGGGVIGALGGVAEWISETDYPRGTAWRGDDLREVLRPRRTEMGTRLAKDTLTEELREKLEELRAN